MSKAKRKPKKNQIIILCLIAVLTLGAIVCAILCFAQGRALQSQRAAERFRGESKERFAQVTAFFPVGKETDQTAIFTFRSSIGDKLSAASLEAPEQGSLWKDGYSAFSEVSVSGSKGSATAQTIGVGGDWFAFHPLRLLSGSYIKEDDLMHDAVLLDETLAWRLFGGYDLAGMTVAIAGEPYLVAGVVERETDDADKKAYSDDGLLIMHYDAMNALTEEGIGVSSYELICADPITGFALDVVGSGFSEAVTVQNTRRFSLVSLFKVIGAFGSRVMSEQALALPYWENAARLTENRAAVLLLITCILALFPLICLAWLLVFLGKKLIARLKTAAASGIDAAADKVRERQRQRLLKREKEQYKE